MRIALANPDGTHITTALLPCRPMLGDVITLNPNSYHVDKVAMVSMNAKQPAQLVAFVHDVTSTEAL